MENVCTTYMIDISGYISMNISNNFINVLHHRRIFVIVYKNRIIGCNIGTVFNKYSFFIIQS